jgi:hypothetical protein
VSRSLQIFTTVAVVYRGKGRRAWSVRAAEPAPEHICIAIDVGIALYEATLHTDRLHSKGVECEDRLIGSLRSCEAQK